MKTWTKYFVAPVFKAAGITTVCEKGISGLAQDIPSASNGMTMQSSPSIPPTHLGQAIAEMLKNPVRTVVPPWSWKAAACTALVRAFAFFATNLKSGPRQATKAMIVEALFAIFAGGLVGAVSQYLRRAKPLWQTGLFLCIGLPGLITFAQLGVHHLARTKHQGGGIVASFVLAGIAAAYSWYAMRHGAMLGGIDATTLGHDLRCLPRISLNFLLIAPRLLSAKTRSGDEA